MRWEWESGRAAMKVGSPSVRGRRRRTAPWQRLLVGGGGGAAAGKMSSCTDVQTFSVFPISPS